MRRFDATPAGRRRRATPSSPAQNRIKEISYGDSFPAFVAHSRSTTSGSLTQGSSSPGLHPDGAVQVDVSAGVCPPVAGQLPAAVVADRPSNVAAWTTAPRALPQHGHGDPVVPGVLVAARYPHGPRQGLYFLLHRSLLGVPVVSSTKTTTTNRSCLGSMSASHGQWVSRRRIVSTNHPTRRGRDRGSSKIR